MARTIIASSSSRTTTESFDVVGRPATAAQIIVDATSGVTVTDTLIVSIDAYDDASGKWYNILTSLAITAVGTTILKVGLGLNVAANTVANDFLPDKYRVTITKNNATSITYSIGIVYIDERG